MSLSFRRLSVLVVVTLMLTPFLGGGASKKAVPAIQHYNGKVVPLADLLAKDGVRLDADAAPHWLALAADDGAIYPLVKDSGSRLFFLDAELLKRPMRLTGRVLFGSRLLQVTAAHSYHKGKLHEVYYWCDVCSIRRGEKNVCECCGGPMVRHEDPVKK